MLQRNVNILLAIQFSGIATHAALQPVIFFVVTRQARKGVIVCRTGGGDARGDHGIFIGLQRLLRLAVLRLKTCRITQYQRVFH